MSKKIYFTEEERREANRKRCRERYQRNREERLRKQKEYNEEHKEQIRAYQKEYKANHKEERRDWERQNYQKNRERTRRYYRDWYRTKEGKATHLARFYKWDDRKKGHECDLTSEFILNEILSKPCFYCGETDWHKIGMDRVINSLGHLQNNVVPCCCSCNASRKDTPFFEFVEKRRASLPEGSKALLFGGEPSLETRK